MTRYHYHAAPDSPARIIIPGGNPMNGPHHTVLALDVLAVIVAAVILPYLVALFIRALRSRNGARPVPADQVRIPLDVVAAPGEEIPEAQLVYPPIASVRRAIER
jgi:hypothetical protein